jgi:O-antigen ligase
MRPLHVVMACLAGAVIAGGFLLLSAAESTTLVDGTVEWHAESPLRAIVQLLCLNYQFPTIHAGEIKGYLLGVGAGLALIVLSIAALARPQVADPADSAVTEPSSLDSSTSKTHLPPLVVAQLLALLYVLWSFASSRWSADPRVSIGGSMLLAIGLFWSFSLAYGLNTTAAQRVARILTTVTGLTAALALWYYYGRNPVLRAKFPFGNPNFLSAALVPGALLVIAVVAKQVAELTGQRTLRPLVWVMVGWGVLGMVLWVLALSDSRAANLALLGGGLAMTFFALPTRWKWAPGVVTLAVGLAAWYFVTFMGPPTPGGRGATVRLRIYAWSYAWRMFADRPLTGYGQGGFAMVGDSFSTNDVVADPEVFESRVDHAHSEWLEVLADLGIVGIVLFVGMVSLTLYAAATSRRSLSDRSDRATVIALLGGLVGLLIEETFGVGLRVCEVPLVFFTIIGLLWSFSRSTRTEVWWGDVLTPPRRRTGAIVGLLLGAAVLIATQRDFHAARQAFRTDEFLKKGEYDAAIHAASLAVDRLYPQRYLMNLFRLAQTHVAAADHLQERALDRQQRALESEPPNARLQALAADDYRATDEHCKAASHVLKPLVFAAPGYIQHGQLEYRINVLQARGAMARGENEASQAYLRNAAAAIERELTRQPFDAAVAVDFFRLAAGTPDAEALITTLARPLRYARITDLYVEVLRDLARSDSLVREFERIVDAAQDAPAVDQGGPAETWAAEKLRLGATADFLRGEYRSAVRKLEQAALRYDRLGAHAPLGAASCFAELADSRFYADPDYPKPALEAAGRALELAPESRPGRELKTGVKQRLIHYHLADGNEAQAGRTLRELAPASIQPHVLDQELGTRYRRLCESLLQRREGQTLRKPADAMLPKLTSWLRRAMELNPRDAAAHFVAADLALYGGDDAAAAEQLEEALRLGLPSKEGERFLQMALRQRPDSASLKAVREKLESPALPEPRVQPQP